MNSLKDSAAFGRQQSYSYGEAIKSATEGLKNENSVLVDNAGVTKNVAKMWEDYAKAQGKSVSELTKYEKIQAEVNGIIEESKFQQGDAAKYAKTFSGRVAQLSATFYRLKSTIGSVIMPIASLFIPIIQKAMNALISFFGVVKQVMRALGFDMSSGISNTSKAYEQLGSSAFTSANAIEKASKKAKKANATMNYDELNVLKRDNNSDTNQASDSTPTITGSGLSIGDAIGISAEDTISPKAQKIANNIKKALGVVQSAFLTCKDYVTKNWDTIVSVVLGGTAAITTAFVGFKIAKFVKTISKAGGVLKTFKGIATGLSAVLGGVSLPVIAIVGAIALLVGAIVALYTKSETFRKSVNSILSLFANSLKGVFELFTNTIIPGLINGFNSFIVIMQPLIDFITNTFVSVWRDILQPALVYLAGTVIPELTKNFENLWNNVLVPFGKFIGSVLEPLIKIISEALDILWKNVCLPLADFLGSAFSKVFESVVEIWKTTLIPAINNLITIFQFLWNNVLSPIVNFLWKVFKPAFEQVCASIGTIFNGLKKVFSGVIDFVTGIFTGNWSKAWNGVKQIFSGIWDTISGLVTKPLNLILSGIEKFINKLIDGFNSLKKAINKISFDVPDWVPGIGGKKWGFNLKMSEHVKLPKLAEGGWVEPNKPRPVIVGDNKREGEIIAPESKIYDQAYKAAVAANSNNSNVQRVEITLIHKYPDGRYMIQEINDTQIKDGKITLLT